MSFQLLMDNMLSRASDVYSFGIIMFELLTFRIPFEELRKEQVGTTHMWPLCGGVCGGQVGEGIGSLYSFGIIVCELLKSGLCLSDRTRGCPLPTGWVDGQTRFTWGTS
jgi:serine/threonine protein kinase